MRSLGPGHTMIGTQVAKFVELFARAAHHSRPVISISVIGYSRVARMQTCGAKSGSKNCFTLKTCVFFSNFHTAMQGRPYE